MSSSCSASLARSHSMMSTAYAEVLSDMFLRSCLLTIARHASRPFGACVRCTSLSGSCAVVLCSTRHNDASIVLNALCVHSTAKTLLSNLSVRDFERTGFADTFRNAVWMLFDMSIMPLPVSFSLVRNCCAVSAMSCQLWLKSDHVCSHVKRNSVLRRNLSQRECVPTRREKERHRERERKHGHPGMNQGNNWRPARDGGPA